MMNSLQNKNEEILNGYYIPGSIPHGIDKLTTRQLCYKKLGIYLLLLYQSYLKGETTLEPEIKMALWRMVNFDKEFPVKIRMTQLDYLHVDHVGLDTAWDETEDRLFPDEEMKRKSSLSKQREQTIKDYKEAVTELIQAQV